MACETPIPAIDVSNPNQFTVQVPTAFDLPQTVTYAQNLSIQEITLLIAAFLELAGLNPSVAALTSDAQTYSCLPQNLQIAAVDYQLCQVLIAFAQAGGGGFVFEGNWGGNTPTITPTTAAAIGIDSVTKRQWQWAAGIWT